MKSSIHNLHLTSLGAAVCVLLTSNIVFAQQIYKWQDEKGAIHYTQSPPSAKNAIRMDIKTRAPVPSTVVPETKPAASAPQPATVTTTPQKLKAEDCAIIKGSLEELQSGRRLYESDKNGERSYLTEEQKAERIKTYSKNLSDGCS